MKNRAKTPGQLLVEFVSKPRSAVYKEICAASTDENGFQFDGAGARLKSEMKSVLTDLLSGRNFDQINQALCRHASQKKEVKIRAVGENKYYSLDFYIAETRPVSLGRKNICHVDAIYPNPETAHELIYGVLKRALESGGDIEQLGLCRRQACKKMLVSKKSQRRILL